MDRTFASEDMQVSMTPLIDPNDCSMIITTDSGNKIEYSELDRVIDACIDSKLRQQDIYTIEEESSNELQLCTQDLAAFLT
jgi:hypothetical protein